METAILFIVLAILINTLLKPKKKKKSSTFTYTNNTKTSNNFQKNQQTANYQTIQNSSDHSKQTYNNLTFYEYTSQKTSYDEKTQKGKNYELYVGKYLEQRGYNVEYHGIIKGRFDRGVDLIGRRNNEIIFVQCKNWNENTPYKITIQDIQKFIKGTKTYLEDHPVDRIRYRYIKRVYAISGKILSKSAYRYIKENNHLITFWIIPYHSYQSYQKESYV